MYSPGQHISTTAVANSSFGDGASSSVIDQCIAELMYSQAVLKLQQSRLLDRDSDSRGLKVSRHD